ncbi:MAG TPA: hypothetical protein VI542_27775 [Candidatus Tectomicrobia bacterium]
MPKGITGTARTDAAEQLRKSIEAHKDLLLRQERRLRHLERRTYQQRCLEIGKIVEACGLFEMELGELEALLKAGKRAMKEKRGESEG